MSLEVEYRREVIISESLPSRSSSEALIPSTPSKHNRLSTVLELSSGSPVVDGFRQSTLNFSKSEDKLRHEDVENIEPTDVTVKSLCATNAPTISAAEKVKTRGRPKKQTLIYDVNQDTTIQSASPKRSQHVVKSVRGRRKAQHIRRSVSTSNLPATVEEEIVKPKRQMANSVSPKKQLRSEDIQKPCSNTANYQQTKLTGFGIRRTARQFAKDLKIKQEHDIVASILNKEETGMKVVMTEVKGRGVISTRPFSSGDFVVEYAGELISDGEARIREIEYKKNPDVGSYMFFFAHGGQRYCVDATAESGRMGRLFNHSRLHPNCVVKVVPIDGLPRLTLFAKHDICPGEEFLYDYGDRDKESLISHPWLKC